MFFTFPEDANWNDDRQAVEFGVEIGEYAGTVRVGRRVFQRLLSDGPTPERCVEGYHLHRTRFEQIAERKVRRRQLTEDCNIEITGRDLSEKTVCRTARSFRAVGGAERLNYAGGAFSKVSSPSAKVTQGCLLRVQI